MLDVIEHSPRQEANASVIWLHGLGADGHDFEPIVKELDLPSIRFILPHAPYRPVSINKGYEMRAWFDILGLDLDSPQDEAGIRACQQKIENLVLAEINKGIPSHRIVLAGFSQGGAIALHTALRYPFKLAGAIILSSWLPLQEKLAQETHEANHDLPILLAHGTFDDIVPLEAAQRGMQLLSEAKHPVTFKEYPMAHHVCDQEVKDIRQFLCSILSI